MAATEVGAAIQGDEQGGRGCPYLGENLRGGGSGSSVLLVVDIAIDTTHWESSRRIQPQVDPRLMGRQPQRGRNGGWVYPPLAEAMAESGLQDLDTYVSF